MSPFDYHAPTAIEDAFAPAFDQPHGQVAPGLARFIAGGTNLIDLMKERIESPAVLVDVNRLPLAEIALEADGSLRLGATARNADTADHPLVRRHHPLLREAILAGASPQIRNRATNAGNLLQRTRCYYFYDVGVPCNKRRPGSGCPAATGLARQHAILGATAHCIATHPSDMCVALAALDARVHVRSPTAQRTIPFADFHRLPGDRPERDTNLADDELITHLTLPPAPRFAGHAAYLKVRERASYAFALVSVAAALDLDADGTVRDARVALGGVAHKPWRDPAAEALLVGRRPDEAAFAAVADALLADATVWGARGLPNADRGNAFKIPLARRAIGRALAMARDGTATDTGADGAAPTGDSR